MSEKISATPRMSNTAEILTKQFRGTFRGHANGVSVAGDDFISFNGLFDDHDQGNGGRWSWRRYFNEFFNIDHHRNSDVNELFPKYLVRLQHNFFVSLLLLGTFFNVISIVVALVNQSESEYPTILFMYVTSLIIFMMFLVIALLDEHLLRPKFSRCLASVTVLVTMVFTEYGNEFLQLNHIATFSLQRIRPIIHIIIVDHLLLPFSTRISAIVSTVVIILIELTVSLYQRFHKCKNHEIIIRLVISETLFYVYAAFFGLYMSRLLEIIIKRAFKNHYDYIESKFNIQQEQEHQEELLRSCFPKHLIDNVQKDLKDIIKVIDGHGKVKESPFKTLYIVEYDNVSILYADIVNSMLLTNNLSPNELVETLNDVFGRFDQSADKNKCLRIKLLGDCYYCVAGLPNFDQNHAWNCLQMGLDMIKIINSVRKAKNININMRIGIHSGMVLSGIIGVHKWQFDIWSEDSILASQMEHDGVPGCVHITERTLDLIGMEKLKNYEITKKITNERVGYIIKKKSKKVSIKYDDDHHNDLSCGNHGRHAAIMHEISSIEDVEDDDQIQRFKEDVCKIKPRTSFSTIRSKKTMKNQLERYLNMKTTVNEFINGEIEKMPLSFKKNFKNFHGINPVTLMFEESKYLKRQHQREQRKRKRKNTKKNSNDSNNDSGFNEPIESNDDVPPTEREIEDNWKLEKEFLTLPDEFFFCYLLFSLFLSIIIGLHKNVIMPKLHRNMATIPIQLFTLIIIVAFCFYSYKNSIKLTFWKRNLIWLLVSLLFLINSMHDLLLFDCKHGKQLVLKIALEQYDSGSCPYIWNFTMCTIISMTGISIFITVNLWFKFFLRIIGLITFTLILLNQCSLYQTIIPNIDYNKQWISNIGFDPILSHFYYMFMAVIILTLIDRQIEYIFRLDFKLSKRLQKEKHDAQIMAEINQILLKNILPSHVVAKYLSNSAAFIDQLYSESYRFCVVMFASIPNYSQFYTENQLNGHGKKCLQLLNEIICDFDQLLYHRRFQSIEKIKTFGSTYMVAAGLEPGRNSDDTTRSSNSAGDERKYVMTMIHFVMALMETLKKINKDALQDFKLRVGIAVGPAIAGIVGASKPQYDIWGDTVNVASRMDSTGILGRIQITKETAEIIQQNDDYREHFDLEERGEIDVKGKGCLVTYLVKTKFDFEEKEITYV